MTELDLGALDTTEVANAGTVMELINTQTNQPILGSDEKPVTFTLLGSDSEAYRKVKDANTNRRLKAGQRGRIIEISAEQLEAEETEVLVACTIAWSDNFVIFGEKLPCTPVNARKVYRIPMIREQVEAWIKDRGNFLKPSKTA